VIAIIATLIAVFLPALSGSRQSGYAAKCGAQLRVLGQGMTMYWQEHGDILVPGRLPRVDQCTWFATIIGGTKYRPTFLAMMGNNVGARPFDQPMECANQFDGFGERGDRQNYSDPVYVCPRVPEWTDERNGSYGYNYQFLGNSRLRDAGDIHSFKNWPVVATKIHDPAQTVAVADSMGTAATYPVRERVEYENNGAAERMYGNEGFNLDPPRIDQSNGEAAGFADVRTAVDPRHLGRGNVMWVDGHVDANTLEQLGYHVDPEGRTLFDGNNGLWSGSGRDEAWTPGYRF
jgi:prepilin-type processing-associated H-X9-DG protein